MSAVVSTACVSRSGRFRVGVALILGNYPIGWLVPLLLASLAAATALNILFILAAAVYAFSWIMLGLGLFLAGPEGLAFLKERLGRLWLPRTRKADPDRRD